MRGFLSLETTSPSCASRPFFPPPFLAFKKKVFLPFPEISICLRVPDATPSPLPTSTQSYPPPPPIVTLQFAEKPPSPRMWRLESAFLSPCSPRCQPLFHLLLFFEIVKSKGHTPYRPGFVLLFGKCSPHSEETPPFPFFSPSPFCAAFAVLSIQVQCRP